MKGTVYITALLLLAGCGAKKDAADPGQPVMVTSILPLTGLTKTIAGDRAAVYTLVGEGQSPHAYEPTAKQLSRLADADALLTIGVPFEQSLLNKTVPLYPELNVVDTRQGITLRAMAHEHHGEHCTQNHGGADPHVWLAPQNVRIMAGHILQALEQADPEHAETYRHNYDIQVQELQKLDAEISAMLAPYKGSRFYVFHPSFGYFADAYGLTQVPIELDGKAPSPRQLTGLIEQAKADGVKVIFVQKQFPAGSGRAIADAIGGAVIQLDPLAEDCIANLRRIADSITQTLKQ